MGLKQAARTLTLGFFMASTLFAREGIPPVGGDFRPDPQRGVCVTPNFSESGGYGGETSRETFRKIAASGANYVTLTPLGWSYNLESTEIFGYRGENPTLTPDGVRQAIRDAHAAGLKVLLNPHLWVGLYGTPTLWRGKIKMKSERDWDLWFGSYKDFIGFWAKMADEEKVALFSVGSELVEATRARPETWKDIISYVRGIYSGPCIYSANWLDEYERIPFWNQLEYVAISAYFPIGAGSKEERLAAASEVRAELKAFAENIGKPVLFAESGFRSIAEAGAAPAEWVDRGIPAPDFKEQALCYEVWIETFGNERWLSGIHWWAQHSDPEYIPFVANGYSFSGKPAGEILSAYFKRTHSE